MKDTKSDNDRYVAFVTGIYRRNPLRVVRLYRTLFAESRCWPEGALEDASEAEIGTAVEALIEQDAQGDHEAWAFRNSFEMED